MCVTDADLVARARQGDQAAFGELVDRHRTAVYRAALAALRSHADADDAAQDTFVLAWRRLGSFRGGASFRTWLLAIAWHQALNRRRGLVRWWKQMAPLDGETGEEPAEPASAVSGFPGEGSRTVGRTPEQLASGNELQRDIRAAIRALPPKLRDTLLLAQGGDYSYEEIGTMLKAPTGTIKWRVSEARRLVKKRLQERGHEELG